MGSKPLAAGRRKHHPILARDTTGGDNNSMFVVRDQARRREVLDREQAQLPPVDTKHVTKQLQDSHITDIHDVEKRHSSRGGAISDTSSANPTPRKGWRK